MADDSKARGGGNKPIAFEDGFPNSHAICSAFFSQPEASTKNWASLDVLVTSDDKTFWTVVATHPKLPVVVDQLVRSVDESHATASKQHRVPKQQEKQLIQFLVRLMTSFVPISSSGSRLSTSSVAIRFSHIIPSSLLLPISLMLLRASGPVASTALATFLLTSPIALTHFTSVTAMWYDSVTQIASKCVHEAKRGRFQRRGGDIMPLIERTYRLTKHMWALFNTAPYFADYCDIRRVIVGLRIVTDIISPQLQHFIMASDELAARRPQLTKANAMILNAAIGAATLATIFFSFANDLPPGGTGSRSSAAAASKKVAGSSITCIAANAMKSFDESCAAYILQYCPGTPAALVERNRRLHDIFHAIEKPPTHEEGMTDAPSSAASAGVRLAAFLEWANGPIPNSNDFVDGLIEGQERLGPCLLTELLNQGYSIDKLVVNGFINDREAARWGAGGPRSTAIRTAAVSSSPTTTTAAAHIAHDHNEFERVPTGDPAVDMVLSVLPHFTPTIAANALGYYNGDVEQLINDALSGNLPPHLESELPPVLPDDIHDVATSAADACIPDDAAYHHQTIDAPPAGDMERFVSSHYVDEEEEGDDDDGHGMLTTVDGHALSDTLYLDEGFREHTFEFLYEDERDDANDGEAHVWGAIGGNDSSEDDEMRDLVPLNNHAVPVVHSQSARDAHQQPQRGGHQGQQGKPGGGGVGAGSGSAGRPQGGGNDRGGRGRGSGRGGRGGPAAAAATAGGDDGARGYKKTKERKAGGGGSKSALQRTIKRSGYE